MKVLDNNELNLDQLDNVTGGNGAVRHGARSPVTGKMPILNPVLENINTNLPDDPVNASRTDKPFNVCPVCHSTAIKYNRVENICSCQDCGYSVDNNT